jgi:D-psicose/D-tagatose/L-ribulose 3-epimerase
LTPADGVKYGAHIFLWIDAWSSRHIGLLERARRLGLQSLEISVGDDIEFDAALVRREAAAQQLDITISPGGVWPMRADVSLADPEARAYGLQWHQHCIDQAGEAGAVAYTGALYSHPGHVERRLPNAEEFAIAAENLHILAEYASRRGVELVFEPMSRFRTHLVNTPRQALAMLAQADHPNLKVLFDTFHAVTEVRDFGAAVRDLAPYLWGLHACESDRGAPGGGIVPWPAVFEALREVHFQRYIVLETYNTGLREFAYARGLYQDVCPDGDEFVRKSLDFLFRFAL